MRYILIVLGLAMLGFLFIQRQRKAAQPPPAPDELPPPPAPVEATPVLSPEEIRKVIDATRDANANVRWEALKFLLQLNVPEAEQVLFSMLARDDEPTNRRNIVALLADRKPTPQATRAIAAALKDADAGVRTAAIQALVRIGDYSTAPAISELLRDVDEGVKLQALNALNALQSRRNEEVKREMERQEALRQEMMRKAAEEAAKRKQ